MAPRVILQPFGSSDTLHYIKFYICDYNWPVAAENRLWEARQEIITALSAALYSSRHGAVLYDTESKESLLCLQCEGAHSLLCLFQLLVSEEELLAARGTFRAEEMIFAN